MQINIGDIWKNLVTANCQINIGDVWKSIPYCAINIGDVWLTVWGTPPASGDFLTQEDGTSYLLQETNDKIKLESSS
jgi:hypothetical protein